MNLKLVNKVKQLSGNIKKIVLPLICFFVFATPVSAEILRNVGQDGTFVSSQYTQLIQKKDDAKYFVFIEFLKGRIPFLFSVIKGFSLSIETRTTDYVAHDNFEPLIVFSLQTPPKFEITKNNSTETFVITKSNTRIASHKITHFLGPVRGQKTFDAAEKIVVLLPLSNGTEMRIELPEEIVKEWSYIYAADMRKEKKETLNK